MASEHLPIFDALVRQFGQRIRENVRDIEAQRQAFEEAVAAGASPGEMAEAIEAAPLLRKLGDDAPEM